jgi:hypothetical protein
MGLPPNHSPGQSILQRPYHGLPQARITLHFRQEWSYPRTPTMAKSSLPATPGPPKSLHPRTPYLRVRQALVNINVISTRPTSDNLTDTLMWSTSEHEG